MYSREFKICQTASELLIQSGAHALPVDPVQICHQLDIAVVSYSDSLLFDALNYAARTGEGFACKLGGQIYICLNDVTLSQSKHRLVTAHLLGHILFGHTAPFHALHPETEDPENIREAQANQFARDLLCPLSVLEAMHIQNPVEIMAACQIPRISAERQTEQLQKRHACPTATEMELLHGFASYINKFK